MFEGLCYDDAQEANVGFSVRAALNAYAPAILRERRIFVCDSSALQKLLV